MIRARGYSPRLLALFGRYLRRYVRGISPRVRVARDALPPPITGPTISMPIMPRGGTPSCCSDCGASTSPATRLRADRCRRAAPLSAARAFRFLRYSARFRGRRARISRVRSRAVLATGRGIVALTAQGQFSDVRPRPVTIKRGLGTAAATSCRRRARAGRNRVSVLERAFARVPDPLRRRRRAPARATSRTCMPLSAAALERTLDELAALAVARDAAPFERGVGGSRGRGWLPTCRSACARGSAGRRFDAAHAADRARRRRPLTWPRIVAWIAALLAALPAALLAANLPLLRGLGRAAAAGQRAKRISVLIPARDEQHNIGAALDSVLAAPIGSRGRRARRRVERRTAEMVAATRRATRGCASSPARRCRPAVGQAARLRATRRSGPRRPARVHGRRRAARARRAAAL